MSVKSRINIGDLIEDKRSGMLHWQIEEKYKIGGHTLRKILKENGFALHEKIKYKNIVSYDELYQKYIIENKSLNEIAKDLNIKSATTIRQLLRYHNISQRTYSLSQEEREKKRNRRFCGFKGLDGSYFNKIKNRRENARRELEFTVTIEYCWWLYKKQRMRCALSGDKIFFVPKFNSANRDLQTASLDRIDSNKGYVPGNVQWIHKELQPIKWTYSQEKCVNWCTKIYKHNQRKKKWASR